MVVTKELIGQVLDTVQACETAIVRAYQGRPGNPNQIELASFGETFAMRVPYIPFFNRVYGFTEDQAEHLPAIIDFYKQTKTRFMLWLSPEAVDEKCAHMLAKNDFIPWGYHTKFYAALNEIAPVATENGVEAQLVEEAQRDEYLDTMLTGWGMPLEHRGQAKENMRLRFGIPGMHFFLGRQQGKALGGAVFFQHGEVGYLADAATPLENRGRGCQQKLMEARLALARKLGCRLIVGGAYFGNSSFRNMQRIGLKIAFTDMAWHYIAMDRFAEDASECSFSHRHQALCDTSAVGPGRPMPGRRSASGRDDFGSRLG